MSAHDVGLEVDGGDRESREREEPALCDRGAIVCVGEPCLTARFDEPIVVTMPSPTRARIVSSPAPPTRRSMFARTVTRLIALT